MQRPSYAFLDTARPVAIAHRGGSLEAEENTLPAFEAARAAGYRDLELDVHLTRDGEVVVHHDDSLLRMFGDPRRLGDLDWKQLSALRTPSGAGLPKLAEVLHAFPDMRLTVEMKSDAVVAPLAGVISRAGALDRVCLGAFAPQRTQTARRLLGERLCWSPGRGGVAALAAAGWGLPFRPGFGVVQVPQVWKGVPVITPRFMRAARRAGVQVQVWTVNEAAQMHRLLDLGVDGIMTDRPTLLREVLQSRGAWAPSDAGA